ncbi:MAG: hypothetical protein KatS3mg112_1192 [Thermogutta sp.]|nr:MAG: hypothetical protein KatS3mg112_1192 [Thermogutta sp.]
MVLRQLFDNIPPAAVYPTVPNLRNPRPGRQDGQGTHRGPHPPKILVGLGTLKDFLVGFPHSLAEGFWRWEIAELAVGQGNDFRRFFAGRFPSRMSAHAVSHQEKMPPVQKSILATGEIFGVGILIVVAAQANIAFGCYLKTIFPTGFSQSIDHSLRGPLQLGPGLTLSCHHPDSLHPNPPTGKRGTFSSRFSYRPSTTIPSPKLHTLLDSASSPALRVIVVRRTQ